MEKTRITAQFLASKRHTPFVWGENDCHTIVLELNDSLYNENSLDAIYKKYKDVKGCYRLAKTLDAQQYMESLGYTQGQRIIDADIVLVKHKHGYFSHIALAGNLYSMNPEKGLVGASVKAFKDIEYTIWRRT